MDGWNSSSGKVFATPFAENGNLAGFDGTHLMDVKKSIHFINKFLTLMSKEAPHWKDKECTISDPLMLPQCTQSA
jgi:hypothetical protein